VAEDTAREQHVREVVEMCVEAMVAEVAERGQEAERLRLAAAEARQVESAQTRTAHP
jgi:hypothetical protein